MSSIGALPEDRARRQYANATAWDYSPRSDNVVLARMRDELGSEFDRFIADVKADAWDEGLKAGWEECQNPGPFVNDWWDSKLPNPYRIESDS